MQMLVIHLDSKVVSNITDNSSPNLIQYIVRYSLNKTVCIILKFYFVLILELADVPGRRDTIYQVRACFTTLNG